uniref:phosphomevalonate kinase n=1 Tax=Albugo laibachii Nc14 TaxID=890382 RepID=F0W398_9STRA|nr:conserved hypothetical protein [Albugo laibachii Nc14]|eukprot:CCA15541.1 conserved hypothetical protein [Albugo laibachii Nc14]
MIGTLRSEGSDCNAYVTETIQIACNCISGLISLPLFAKNLKEIKSSSQKILIRLEADNDFYSQVSRLIDVVTPKMLPATRSYFSSVPIKMMRTQTQFDAEDSASEISKTGLGSSAALVTSLVGALVAFFIPNWQNLENDCDALDVVHNLAQLCHSAVQRKIGSGFDISAACYGSQRYRRFPPQLLENISSQDDVKPQDLASCVKNQSIWKSIMRVESFELPPGFCCLMGDVVGGTSTVSMVQQVLAWTKENPKPSRQIFDMIHSRNQQVEDTLIQLTMLLKKHPESNSVRRKLATTTSEMWPTIESALGIICSEIRQSFLHVRQSLRELGRLTDALIEPPEQTALIDETMKVPGVLFAGVPGAGGYDAIFVVAMDESVLTHVEDFWEVWSANHSSIVCPLLCEAMNKSSIDRIGALRSTRISSFNSSKRPNNLV